MRVFVAQRRRENGSFNNTPSDDGSDGHVVATWWGLQAERLPEQVPGRVPEQVPDRADELRERTVAWLQACQQADGGFTWQPKPFMSSRSTAAYTRAALRSLQLLNAKPLDQRAATEFLHSLKNPDNGYAERPGWLSNPLSTYHVVDALAVDALAVEALAVEALASLDIVAEADRPSPRSTQIPRGTPAETLPPRLKVFSAQIQAHGTGSPRDAVLLAQRLGIHLWGAKNAEPQWIAAAQRIADRDGVAVQFVVADEDYGTWMEVPGQGTYSHMSDIMAENASVAEGAFPRGEVMTWDEYRTKRMQPLEKSGGRLIMAIRRE